MDYLLNLPIYMSKTDIAGEKYNSQYPVYSSCDILRTVKTVDNWYALGYRNIAIYSHVYIQLLIF